MHILCLEFTNSFQEHRINLVKTILLCWRQPVEQLIPRSTVCFGFVWFASRDH